MYVVVVVGLTLVEPLAEVEVNDPGVIAIEDAPVVAQLKLLLDPELILVGFAENVVIVGLLAAAFTVTVTVSVDEPEEFVAVSVYVVVAVGFTLVEPFAAVDVNVPGVIETAVAPLVAQLSVVLAPEFIVFGLAPKDVIAGTVPCGGCEEP